MWSICDSRNGTCVHAEDTCNQLSWDGESCEWHGGKNGVCLRDEGTKEPEMIMYSKQYKDYFNPNDNTKYHFTLTLKLGVYGAIDKVVIEDKDTNLLFDTNENGCVLPDGYTLNKKDQVTVDGLPSGVVMELTCLFPHTKNRHWDVTELKE
jgi:hypothetical protein